MDSGKDIHGELAHRMGILTARGAIGHLDAVADKLHQVEKQVRERFSSFTRNELKRSHPLNIYVDYYRGYGYNYHLLGQLESVIGGKNLMAHHPAVTVMFAAEMKNQLLTAAHDLACIQFPIIMHQSPGGEAFVRLGGQSIETLPGDWQISDRTGIISSVLRGPDHRTAVTEKTEDTLFTVYGLPGISDSMLWDHLNDMAGWIHLAAPQVQTRLAIVGANSVFEE